MASGSARPDRPGRVGQAGSACTVSLAHGSNDAQQTMGVITLALIASGTGNPESAGAIKRAIAAVAGHHEPKDCDVARVRARLAGGWPLAKPEHFDPVHWP